MYAKLFKQVITSSLTQDEPIDVRGVFFMLLAVAEKDGEVPGNDEAIARIINVPFDVFVRAVARLMRPDPRSASKECGGKRLVNLESCPGYRIVNYVKYSGINSDEKRREYFRNYQRQRRKTVMKSMTPTKAGFVDCKIEGSTVIPESLASHAMFLKTWQMWLEHLVQKRKPATLHAQDLQLAKLVKMGPEKAIKTLEHCAERNWQGIFEINENHAGNSAKPNPRNVGVAIGPTDYGEAARRKLERQALEAGHQAAPKAQGT